ncbi:disease resistance protein Pik-2-like [Aegilops tauschii subsp. strangulata]|uniref:disease resistance protein Pik-2-like n=1 Tax=Aegilops tauschii subsp. strangulata TaxID=200361 RepID=UPI003CC8A7E4
MAVEYTAAFFGAVVPSLGKLLKYELYLEKTVKGGFTSLQAELKGMKIFLEDVSSLAPDLELDRHMKLLADEVRELSRDIDTSLHSFMARIDSSKGKHPHVPIEQYVNHEVDKYIKETRIKVKEVRDRHGTYPSKSSLESSSTRQVDPRILAMYKKESSPVGIAGAIANLTDKLSKSDRVSIVGMAGMGKTTLARAIYDDMIEGFNCKAFVPIGQRVVPEKVLRNIFYGLRIEIYGEGLNHQQLADQLQDSLKNKRFLIVIDDLWDEETWALINYACVGTAGSKIITTSRNRKILKGVADDSVYNIKPLSTDDSKKLLCTKIFGTEDKIHDTDFEKLPSNLFNKCGGVPIAITLVGSLLAKTESKEWHRVYKSIGFDEHKEDKVFENVRKVMHYSYTDLPSHLRGCFLYLSLFPEGHWIEKNLLIWRWVAEGLVPDGSFETGEKYLNNLIDRSMIQLAVSPRDLGQGGYLVHSLMVELIRNLSSSEKENFSTVLGMRQESTFATGPIHRLAIHGTIVGQNQNTSLEVGDVLSFYASTCSSSSFPPLSEFAHLRVIDLEGRDLIVGDCKLKHLGKLKGLKYVRLAGTPVAELPKKIRHLKLLQTLDVTETGVTELPSFVEELTKLRCLRAGKGTRLMGRIGVLASLEELWLHSADKSPDFAAGLRKLTNLRVLIIHFDEMDEGMQKVLVESLCRLEKLQVLQIWFDTKGKARLGGWEGSVPNPELHQLLLFGVILSRQTPWIHHLGARKLSKLLLQVETLTAQHLDILGQMPSLRSLYLHSEEDTYRLSYTANKNEFQVLQYVNTNIELICGDGGLPMIQELEVGGIRAGRDVGLWGNMPLLERATYHLDCHGCLPLRVQKAEEKLKQASQAHPNRPNISIRRWNNVCSCNLHRSCLSFHIN